MEYLALLILITFFAIIIAVIFNILAPGQKITILLNGIIVLLNSIITIYLIYSDNTYETLFAINMIVLVIFVIGIFANIDLYYSNNKDTH